MAVRTGFEPVTLRFVTLQFSLPPKLASCAGLSLHRSIFYNTLGGCRLVSTPSLFSQGLARDCHQHYLKGFPEFDILHLKVFTNKAQILLLEGGCSIQLS